uniref:SWIM-type domain-containing protein n=1 Tax=Ditylenchus dipsaci TaxID=166011 RepID=A0A915E2L1_9BILA
MSLRLMCWFHAMKNIRKRAKDIKLDKQTRIWIYKQLSFLQCAASTQEFVKAACSLQDSLDQLSRKKPLVILLSKYIFDNWIHSDYCNWYEGASDNVSTNNSLESRNRVIKACEVVGKNLPLQKFMGLMKLMVENCSLSPDHQSPAKVPSIAPDVYRQAYQLEKEKRSMVSFGSAYLLPSKSGLHKNLVEKFAALHSLPSYTNWELYKENRSAIHILNNSNGWPNFYCCTCPVGIKKSPCKHSVMLMKITGILSYPRDATAEPLLQKKKRGRPSN